MATFLRRRSLAEIIPDPDPLMMLLFVVLRSGNARAPILLRHCD